MDLPLSSDIPVVLITGFGPFRSVLENPSWEVAKALKNYCEWKYPINIMLEEMCVTYDDVSKKIPDFWVKYNPALVVHIGVAVGTKQIEIERSACNFDYCYEDNNGTVPAFGRCIIRNAPDMITTHLPIDEVRAKVQSRSNLPVSISNDAGRFLCEFIYYQSLFIDPKRVVFIHIPEFNEDFTLENLTKTIQLIIYELLRHVHPLPQLNQDGNYLINPVINENVDTNVMNQ